MYKKSSFYTYAITYIKLNNSKSKVKEFLLVLLLYVEIKMRRKS